MVAAYYNLGAVKPWVKDAAYELGPKFGIKTIYGWAPGKYDHPKGLALDLMINNIPNGRTVGDALAAFALSNAARLQLTYIIWYKRINTLDGRGWRAYSGDSDHTDHVHLSFKANGTSTGGSNGISIPGFDQIQNPISSITDSFKKFETSAKWLSDTHNWLRILYVIVGGALIAGILINLFFKTDAPELIGNVIGG